MFSDSEPVLTRSLGTVTREEMDVRVGRVRLPPVLFPLSASAGVAKGHISAEFSSSVSTLRPDHAQQSFEELRKNWHSASEMLLWSPHFKGMNLSGN